MLQLRLERAYSQNRIQPLILLAVSRFVQKMAALSKKDELTGLIVSGSSPSRMVIKQRKILMKLGALLVGGMTLGAASICLPTASFADLNGVHNITFENLNNFTCAGGICGSVTVSGDGTQNVTIDVLITQSDLRIHGIEETVAFITNPNATSVAFAAATTFPALWSTTIDTTVGQQDGVGSFTEAVNCNGLAGGNLCGTEVKFTLTGATNLTLGSNNGFLASIRIAQVNAQGLATGLTGFAGASVATVPVPGPIVGAGLPGALVACGGLLALARRRRQQIA